MSVSHFRLKNIAAFRPFRTVFEPHLHGRKHLLSESVMVATVEARGSVFCRKKERPRDTNSSGNVIESQEETTDDQSVIGALVWGQV